MPNNAPFRIWITTFVTAGWVILALRFVTKQEWPFAAMSVVAALFYGYRLFSMLQKGNDD